MAKKKRTQRDRDIDKAADLMVQAGRLLDKHGFSVELKNEIPWQHVSRPGEIHASAEPLPGMQFTLTATIGYGAGYKGHRRELGLLLDGVSSGLAHEHAHGRRGS